MQDKSFLIIDDHEESCTALHKMIQRRGGAPECAVTMAEGLAALRMRKKANRPFDVVICDLSLPDSDAEKTVETLKEIGKDTPVRAITGACGEDIIAKCHEAGIPLILKGTSAEGIMESVFYALAEGDADYLPQAAHEIIENRTHLRELPRFWTNFWAWSTRSKLLATAVTVVALIGGVFSTAGVVNATLSRNYTASALAAVATETARALAIKTEARFAANEARIRENEDAKIKIFERMDAQTKQLDRIEHLLDAGDPRIDAMWQQRLSGKTNRDLKNSDTHEAPAKNR